MSKDEAFPGMEFGAPHEGAAGFEPTMFEEAEIPIELPSDTAKPLFSLEGEFDPNDPDHEQKASDES